MMRYGIPSYKLEKDVIDAEIDIIKELGVEIKCGVEVGKDVTIAELKEQGYKAFYIAIGCQGGRLRALTARMQTVFKSLLIFSIPLRKIKIKK